MTVRGVGYSAVVGGRTEQVRIYVDGEWACAGRWDGQRIVDADAALGDDAYDALDAAIAAAEMASQETATRPELGGADIGDDADDPLEECTYCFREVAAHPDVPRLDDEAGWAARAHDHASDCEWIASRAHRLDLGGASKEDAEMTARAGRLWTVDTGTDGADCEIDAASADDALADVAEHARETVSAAHPEGRAAWARARGWTATRVVGGAS